MRTSYFLAAVLLAASSLLAQETDDPYPQPIPTADGVIVARVAEFASLPDIDGVAARIMLLNWEPGTQRFFANDMRGPLYSISRDGKQVAVYLDVNDPKWGQPVDSRRGEQGVQSFAFHPQFTESGAPGYGKFYTWGDSSNTTPTADFTPGQGEVSHHSVLLEWTVKNPSAATYDGDAPRELIRFQQPFRNHNCGHLTFNPLAGPGNVDFGLLYMGIADGGSGGDPFNMAQNIKIGFGKIFRVDPLGNNSANGKYGIPADNPFVGRDDVLPEIYAYGARNPQRFAWDSANGKMYMAEIGQNIVEEISEVPKGANLGWNTWEGSFRFISRSAVNTQGPRSDPSVTYPVVEWGQPDGLFQPQSAATGLVVYRGDRIPQLKGRILFGDIPSGEIFHVSADNPPNGGQDAIRRILLTDGNEPTTLLKMIQAKNAAQGNEAATRADMRLNSGPDGRLFIINKRDGVIREIVPNP
ncbi:MAG: PQQ-dependent sugar dehydrogenase [Acidobacteria bacterium]|nr:PQQ-dependent sugar dehydrogenase [Acidobacteriota bacterium]MDA1233556.1 PQQ-dependent sugar dehydrogenase [Acidobacteriota bacterium]